jgi:hypothetical protein
VPVPRRFGLLVAKLVVSAGVALVLCMATVALDATVLGLVHGADALRPAAGDPDWPLSALALPLSAVSCAWAGLLAAGVFRSATAGLVAVAAVPFALAPALHHIEVHPAEGGLALSAGALELPWPARLPGFPDGWPAALHVLAPPVGTALTVCLAALLCGYLLVGMRGGRRLRKSVRLARR